MMALSALSVANGQIIADKYRVLGLLGQGGMAEIVAAEHVRLHHTVAIKILCPRTPLGPSLVSRFIREARATARLSTQHVARVHDAGTLDSGVPYIVLEHLQGRDFQQLIEAGGPFGVDEAIASMLQVCEVLDEAHRIGIVHRDLKPSNLFLTQRADERWSVKVLDFGIAKIQEECESHGITTSNDVFGTPAYMSPEQIRNSGLVDARTDIWALGLILAECLNGYPVYRGANQLGILSAIAADPVPDLDLARAGVPAELESVIARCLQKEPDARYQSIAELADALRPFAGNEPPCSAMRIGRMRLVQDKAMHRWNDTTLDASSVRPTMKRGLWVVAAALMVASVTSCLMKYSTSPPQTTKGTEERALASNGTIGSYPQRTAALGEDVTVLKFAANDLGSSSTANTTNRQATSGGKVALGFGRGRAPMTAHARAKSSSDSIDGLDDRK